MKKHFRINWFLREKQMQMSLCQKLVLGVQRNQDQFETKFIEHEVVINQNSL